MSREPGFPTRLRWWRRRRGWSQLELAGRAEVSQRHLGFLELERSSPSRDMVIRLATALDVPLRQQNALLLAAGFAPIWQETDLGAPELAQVRDAVDYVLAQQEPFPAVPGAPINLADALVAPDVLRPFLVNWVDVVRYFIRSVEADAAADGTAETAAMLERLLAYKGVRATLKPPASNIAAGPVLPMHFRKGDVSLKLFTTIATLGTPQDITLQELRIECFFPMERETEMTLRAWAAPPKPQRSRSAIRR
jgi:transcriptional regulator with XRE-family HTH domain